MTYAAISSNIFYWFKSSLFTYCYLNWLNFHEFSNHTWAHWPSKDPNYIFCRKKSPTQAAHTSKVCTSQHQIAAIFYFRSDPKACSQICAWRTFLCANIFIVLIIFIGFIFLFFNKKLFMLCMEVNLMNHLCLPWFLTFDFTTYSYKP